MLPAIGASVADQPPDWIVHVVQQPGDFRPRQNSLVGFELRSDHGLRELDLRLDQVVRDHPPLVRAPGAKEEGVSRAYRHPSRWSSAVTTEDPDPVPARTTNNISLDL